MSDNLQVRLDGPSQHGVFILHLGNDENRISYDFMSQFEACLAKVEAHSGPTALVITGEGKFFSNGLKIELLSKHPTLLLNTFHKFLARILSFPVPLIAAINGHAFAGGACLCLACDYRVMNQEKGFLCVNEVDIGLPLTPGLFAVFSAKADRSLWTDMMLKAHRWSGEAALKNRLVHQIAAPDEVLKKAVAVAEEVAPKGANRYVYGSIKRQMYAKELKMLEDGFGFATTFFRNLDGQSKM